MLHFCPNCDGRSVAWDPRCRRFLCLNAGCRSSFPAGEIKGLTEENVLRALGINMIDENTIQAWLHQFASTETKKTNQDFSVPLEIDDRQPA